METIDVTFNCKDRILIPIKYQPGVAFYKNKKRKNVSAYVDLSFCAFNQVCLEYLPCLLCTP